MLERQRYVCVCSINGRRLNRLTVTNQFEALFQYLNIASECRSFSGRDAYNRLLDWFEAYFESSNSEKVANGVLQTARQPVYLQMPFHSVTVVGFYRASSQRGLLVFDPGLPPPSTFSRAVDLAWSPSTWNKYLVLWRYRRGEWYLKRHREFEILRLLPQKA